MVLQQMDGLCHIWYNFCMHAIEKSLIILKYLHDCGEPVDKYNEYLRKLCGDKGPRQTGRYLDMLHRVLDGYVIKEKIGRRVTYRIGTPSEQYSLLAKALEDDVELGILFDALNKGDAESAVKSLAERLGKKSSVYLFFNMPYEDAKQLQESRRFKHLKQAIERHEYRTIHLKGDKKRVFEDVKPIKLLFSEGNWYVAYVDTEEQLRLSRINFIEKVDYSKKNSYQPKSVEKYLKWLEDAFQNSFSRYGAPKQTATLYAKPNIAHYFDEGMKRFFRSQRFVEKDASGGVTFSVDYTQEMEILPFVQRWMPDLLIVAPAALKEAYRKKLQAALDG